MMGCPTPEDLLCAAEGALEPAGTLEPALNEVTRKHVTGCASCRTYLHEMETLMDIGRRRVRRQLEHSDSAARAARFRRRLQEEEQAVARAGAHWRWWWVAAVVPLYVVSLLLARVPATIVSSDDLIARAIVAERARPVDMTRRIRVEVQPTGTEVARPSPLWLVRDVPSAGWAHEDEADGLAPVLEALRDEGVDARPLSASAFGAWRASVPARRDRVAITGDVLVLQTVAPTGRIRLGELMVSRTGYRVVGQVWVIDGVGRVALSEHDVPRTSEAARAANSATAGHASLPAPAISERVTLERTELHARTVLHELEQDGLLRVFAQGARIVVAGVVMEAARRTVEDGLRPIPGLSLELHTSLVPPHEERGGLLRLWSERRLDTPAARLAFTSGLQRLGASARRRTIALGQLAERYPAGTARALPSADRADLQSLVERHVAGLRGDLVDLDAQLMPLLGATGRCMLVTRAPDDWRERATRVTSSGLLVAKQIEKVLMLDDVPQNVVWTHDLAGTFETTWNTWCRESPTVRATRQEQ